MHTIPLHYSDGPSASSQLYFFDEAVVASQARVHGRRMLSPAIDLNRYRSNAVINFIEVEVTTINPTGNDAIRRWIVGAAKSESIFCKNVDGTPNSSTRFSVRVQKPTISLLSKLEFAINHSRAGLARPIAIQMIEVCVDFYSRVGSQDEREKMVGLLQRTYLPGMDTWVSNSSPRFAVADEPWTEDLLPRRRAGQCSYPVEMPTAPVLDSTEYFGSSGGPWMVSIQNKVTGRGTGFRMHALPDSEKRARIAATVTGETLRKLGLTNLSRLETFDFAGFENSFFHFALPTFLGKPISRQHAAVIAEVNRTDRECFSQGGVVCLERWRRLKEQWLTAKPQAKRGSQSPLQRLEADMRALGSSVLERGAGTECIGTTVSYRLMNGMVSAALADLHRRTML